MFDYLSHTSSLSECALEESNPRCGQLSQASLKRLRKIVKCQKLNNPEGSALLYEGIRNSSWNDALSEHSSLSETNENFHYPEEQLAQGLSMRSHQPIRKVIEGAPPPAYRGFSVLHQSSTSSRRCVGSHKAKQSKEQSNGSDDLQIVRQQARSSESKRKVSPMKRFVAVATNPVENNSGKSKVANELRKRIGKPRPPRPSNLLRDRKIAGDKALPDNVSESKDRVAGDLPSATTKDKPSEMSVLEQVQQLLAASDSKVNSQSSAKSNTLGKEMSKKGIYRPDLKKPRPVINPQPPAEVVCKRQRGVSRADLQALVRKQRQARKSDRLNKERAERERRERIQRNLSATAQAAAAAAKAPLPSPRRPLLLTERSAGSVHLEVATEPEINFATQFSLERQRKLDELLNVDDPMAARSPHPLNGLSTLQRTGRSQAAASNRTISSSFSVNHLAPDGPYYPEQSAVNEETFLDSERRTRSPTIAFPVDRDSLQQPVLLNNHPVGRRKPSSRPWNSRESPKQTGALWIPLSCQVSDPCSGSPVENPVLVLNSLDLHADEDHVSSVSSLEEVGQPVPDTMQWMRLEAVGASEPETSTLDDQDGRFVDDLKSTDFDPSQLERRVDALLRLSRAPLDTHLHSCTELAALNQTNNPEYADLKRLIYSDPLRLGALLKHTHCDLSDRKLDKLGITTLTPNAKPVEKPQRDPVALPTEFVSVQTKSTPRTPTPGGLVDEPHVSSSQSTCHNIKSPVSGAALKTPGHIRSLVESNASIGHTTSAVPSTFPDQGPSSSSSEQQNFIASAESDAISSTPRRETLHAASLAHEAPHPPLNVQGASLPPRLTAAALSLRLTEEVNHLEALASSIQHVADIESLRQYAGAQTETVALAHIIKSQQHVKKEDNLSRSPEVKSPRKFPSSVHSQATSVTPDRLHSHSGTHSPQFAEVIRAAEEFKKVERRLCSRTSLGDVSETKSSPMNSATGFSERCTKTPTDHIQSETSVSPSARNVSQRVPTLILKPATGSSRSVSEVMSEVLSVVGNSSAPESTRSLPTDLVSVLEESTSADHSETLVFQEKDASEVRSVSTSDEEREPKLPSSSVTGSRVRCETEVIRSSSSSSASNKVSTHKAKSRTPPRSEDLTAIHRQVSGDSAVPPPTWGTPLNRTDDGSEDVLSLTQIDSGLSKRAALLKMRRERAEKLLALSKNLEQEEAEVVRLEMEALKAYQFKRKKTRTEALRHRFPISTMNRATSCSSQVTDQHVDLLDVPRLSRRSKASETGRSHVSSHLSVTSPSGDTVDSVRELSNLSQTDLVSRVQTRTASIRAHDKSIREMSVKSPPRDLSATAQTISTTTEVRHILTSSVVSRKETSRRMQDSEVSTVVTRSSSSKHNKRVNDLSSDPAESVTSNQAKENTISDRSSTSSSTPPLRKKLMTELVSSSSDRLTPPTPRQQKSRTQPADTRQEFSRASTQKRPSSSNLSSADSMDDEHVVEAPVDDSASVNTSSQIDLSAMESRIRALHCNLQRQEAILARINQRHKYVSTDRLVRFETTVMQHKQLCTDIIESIKKKLQECEYNGAMDFSVRQSLSVPPESGALTRSSVSHGNAASASHSPAIQPFSASGRSTTRASPFEDDSPAHTLVSLAEDLVSATDTEGDLQKLEFDDKVESATSSATLTDGAKTPSGKTSPESQHADGTPQSKRISFRGLENSEADSVKYVSDTAISARSSSPTVREDGSCTPVSLQLPEEVIDAMNENQVRPAVDSSPQVLESEADKSEIQSTALRHSREFQLSMEEYAANLEPAAHHAAITLSAFTEPDVLTRKESVPAQLGTASNENSLSAAVVQPLPRSTSVKVGAVSDLSSPDNKTVLIREVKANSSSESAAATVSSSNTTQLQRAKPLSSDQMDSSFANQKAHSIENQANVVEHLSNELFGKILSNAINEVVHGQEAEYASKPIEVDSSKYPELKFTKSVHDEVSRIEPAETGIEFPPEVDSPTDTESTTSMVAASMDGSLFSAENVRGLVADIPCRTEPLIREALEYCWQARIKAPEGARESALNRAVKTPPTSFRFDVFEEADTTRDLLALPDLRFISRQLVLDLVFEIMQQIYAGEDEEFALKRVRKSVYPRVSSHQFRLWQGHTRPTDKEHVYRIVTSRIQEELGLRTDKLTPSPGRPNECQDLNRYPGKLTTGTRFSRLAQWTLSKKNYLDRLLELELRADESSWLSYVPEEQRLKATLSDQIWEKIVEDALDAMIKQWRTTHQTPHSLVQNVEVAT